jgi:hypothetical protein
VPAVSTWTAGRDGELLDAQRPPIRDNLRCDTFPLCVVELAETRLVATLPDGASAPHFARLQRVPHSDLAALIVDAMSRVIADNALGAHDVGRHQTISRVSKRTHIARLHRGQKSER